MATKDDLLIALANSSLLRLDALGVDTNGRTPASDVVDVTRRALYGRGRLGHFWAQRIHPRLFPQQHRALKRAHELAIEQHQREFAELMDDRARALIESLEFDTPGIEP